MLRKVKPPRAPDEQAKKRPSYPSLLVSPSPPERLVKILNRAGDSGHKPLTQEDLDAMGEAWPEDESVDDFLAWRRASRKAERK